MAICHCLATAGNRPGQALRRDSICAFWGCLHTTPRRPARGALRSAHGTRQFHPLPSCPGRRKFGVSGRPVSGSHPHKTQWFTEKQICRPVAGLRLHCGLVRKSVAGRSVCFMKKTAHADPTKHNVDHLVKAFNALNSQEKVQWLRVWLLALSQALANLPLSPSPDLQPNRFWMN